jgi:hypothetical protein
MRALILLALFCTSAIAEDEEPPHLIRMGCYKADIIVQIAVAAPGVVTFKIPHSICGEDI